MKHIKNFNTFTEDVRCLDGKCFSKVWFDSVNEASRNEKRRRVKYGTSWFINGKRNLGSISTFGIVSPENPNSSSDTTRSENKKYVNEFKKLMRRFGYVYIPIDGHFEGNKEHSFLIFNITYETLEYIAARFEQTSFFYCYPDTETEVVSEYYEKRKNGVNWDAKENPYEFVNKTTIYHNKKNAEDNFSVIGGKYKYTIDTGVFDKVAEQLDENIETVSAKTDMSRADIIDFAMNRVGQKAHYIKMMLREGFSYGDNE